MKHLFRLSSDILDGYDRESVDRTFDDMLEMEIADPPYREFAIEISEVFLLKLSAAMNVPFVEHKASKSRNYLFEYQEVNGKVQLNMKIIDGNMSKSIPELVLEMKLNPYFKPKYASIDMIEKSFKSLSAIICRLLIVTLAAKNHVKEERIDNNLARGRFNKSKAYRKDYPITTTISIGKITETYEGKGGTGSKKRPHMRRGHIRTQHYGPNRELTQKIFIQPVFVNADEGWIAERRAYNVGA